MAGKELVGANDHKHATGATTRAASADNATSLLGARPKLLGALEHATANVVGHLAGLRMDEDKTAVMMNWQGRYKPLDKNSPALTPLTAAALSTRTSDTQLGKVLAKTGNIADNLLPSTSLHQQEALKFFFGEEITAQHIATFATLKKLVARWRSRAAQRKNIIAVEQFAKDDIQKRAIVKHKEQAIVNLPMPITWAIKEEVLAVLSDVVKVYTKEFGSNHKLTTDARRRIEKLQADLMRPRDSQ